MDFIAELEAEVVAGAKCRQEGPPSFWYQGAGNERTTERGREGQARYAQSICAGCPVLSDCLELALRIPAGRHGVWGGTAEWERKGRYVDVKRERAANARCEREMAAAAEHETSADAEPADLNAGRPRISAVRRTAA